MEGDMSVANEPLLYRRQFLLGPKQINPINEWNCLQLMNDSFLSTHPDLPVTVAHCQDRSIYLLGYILDPYKPSFDDSQIMQDVINDSKTADDVFVHIADKCGRFVIIVKAEGDFRIFSDTCGLRQVFYHVDRNDSVWCSSQPHLIAEQLDIEVNTVAKRDLYKASLFKTGEHWYPGNMTLFDNIFHLTPNHYFDLSCKQCIRYWPRERLSSISISECIPKVIPLLSGIIESAVRRFNLAFAISCGIDSRTLLAASKNSAKYIHYFTHASKNGIDKDPDVLIPSQMLKRLGLKHSVLVLPEKIDEYFYSILQKNIFTPRITKGLNAISIHDHFKRDKNEIVIIYGNCSEITKRDRFRFPKTPKQLLSGSALAAMAQMGRSHIAVKEFSRWLLHVKKLTKYNIDILDLMHWEQRVGNWGAMTLSEYEMVHESLCPYSCRKYIEYMLRVPFKYRTNPEYRLHHAIMEAIWPEVLKYEINPTKSRITKSIENVLYRTNIYDPIQFLHIMFYKRFK